jgi:hypothetical protein
MQRAVVQTDPAACGVPGLQFIIDEVFGVPGVGTVVAGEHTA